MSGGRLRLPPQKEGIFDTTLWGGTVLRNGPKMRRPKDPDLNPGSALCHLGILPH